MSGAKNSDELLLVVISRTLDSAREYRGMAAELMKKADDLEAMALKVALEAKRQDNEDLKAFAGGTDKPSAKDIFEDFGDIFSGKKKGASK